MEIAVVFTSQPRHMVMAVLSPQDTNTEVVFEECSQGKSPNLFYNWTWRNEITLPGP